MPSDELARIDPPADLSSRQPHILAAPPVIADDLIGLFLAGRKSTTIRAYQADLADLARFLGADDARAAVDAIIAAGQGPANAWAMAWRGQMTERGLSPATVGRRLAALKSVMKLARIVGRIAWGLDVEAPRTERLLDVKGPGRAGYARMLAAARAMDDTPKSRRDYAILRVLHDRALRRGELVGLDLCHYDAEGRTLFVLGKARNQRETLAIGPETAGAINRWIEARGREPGPLFVSLSPNSRGKMGRLTGEGVYMVIGAIAQAAGLAKGCKPHGLRHLSVTEALEDGHDVLAVQQFSRHADTNTLRTYDNRRRDLGGTIAVGKGGG